MPKAFLGLLLFLLAGCTPTPPAGPPVDHPLNERIWLTAENRFIDPHQLAKLLSDAPLALVGEVHDNPRHHQIEAWVVRALAEANRRPALVAEMIAADQIPVLQVFFAEPRLSADRLDFFLKWQASGWPDWGFYKPIFDRAVEYGFPVAAGNLDRTVLPAMHRQGFAALSADERLRLHLPEALDGAVAAALVRNIAAGHCGQLPAALLKPFSEVQYARDAAMARAMMDSATTADGALLIAGTEHVRRDWAVPSRLVFDFGLSPTKIFSLAMIEVQEGKVSPGDYAAEFDGETLPFDAVWFTAGAQRGDPCAALQGKFK